jgi:4-hydroxy-2-oxoheptanedioate aldolase
MRPSRVKAKLKRKEPVLLVTLLFTDPSVYELAGLMGFDGIWMDMEHHGHSVETAWSLIRASRVGPTDVMVRPAKGEFMRMGRLLEAGARGVLYPRCSDAAEAREVVRWCKFAPLGTRGFDGGNPDMPYCSMNTAEYIKKANEETFVVIQLEDQQAIDHADAIAAVEGVDVLFFGPSDFSILSGIPGQFDHPLVQGAIRKIAEAALKHGKQFCMPGWSPEHIKKMSDLGSRFFIGGCDLVYVLNGLNEAQQRFGQLGFTFDNQLKSGSAGVP